MTNPIASLSPAAAMLVAAVLVAAPQPAIAQGDMTKVQIQSQQVAGNVHMLKGNGGNIGVSAGPDGVLIVDDQFAPLADKIRAALAKINPGKLKFILNTHWHGDHTGGNEALGKDATIIAQSHVRDRLMKDQTVKGETTPAAPKGAWPVVTFDESLSVHFNGEEIKVVHYPHGHTDGDCVIWFTKSGVVHVGDHFFNGRFPFIDLASGGDVEGYLKNVEAILAKLPPGAKIIPGHGPLAAKADLEAFRDMLKDCIGIVKKGIAAGKDKKTLQKEGLPAKYASYDWNFIKTADFIETLYQGLSGKKLS